jgi:hypothetical protein
MEMDRIPPMVTPPPPPFPRPVVFSALRPPRAAQTGDPAGRANFRQRYCQARGIRPEEFVEALLDAGLYPQARLVRRGLERLVPDFFAADREFVEAVGRIRRRAEFGFEAEDFHHADRRRPLLRRLLRLRVSVGRLHREVAAGWAPGERPVTR